MAFTQLPGVYKIEGFDCHIIKGKYLFSGQTFLIAVSTTNGNRLRNITKSDASIKLSEDEIIIDDPTFNHRLIKQLVEQGLISNQPLNPEKGVYKLLAGAYHRVSEE